MSIEKYQEYKEKLQQGEELIIAHNFVCDFPWHKSCYKAVAGLSKGDKFTLHGVMWQIKSTDDLGEVCPLGPSHINDVWRIFYKNDFHSFLVMANAIESATPNKTLAELLTKHTPHR